MCPFIPHHHNFNPRSREGSDLSHATREQDTEISIHAPVKGATFPIAFTMFVMMDFNPRSREGSDIVSVLFSLGICISIHAPVKGATLSCCILL